MVSSATLDALAELLSLKSVLPIRRYLPFLKAYRSSLLSALIRLGGMKAPLALLLVLTALSSPSAGEFGQWLTFIVNVGRHMPTPRGDALRLVEWSAFSTG